MFDITSSKLLILAIVALIVVGPKDLPLLLRTVGKYLGVIRRHAAEFRAQLDEAIREAELEELKKEFEGVGREMRSTIEQGASAVDAEMQTARLEVDSALKGRTGDAGAQVEEALPAVEAPKPDKTGTDAP
jgi:sec-independent protein translocase protein TatB